MIQMINIKNKEKGGMVNNSLILDRLNKKREYLDLLEVIDLNIRIDYMKV